jgi:hypothetical protein
LISIGKILIQSYPLNFFHLSSFILLGVPANVVSEDRKFDATLSKNIPTHRPCFSQFRHLIA